MYFIGIDSFNGHSVMVVVDMVVISDVVVK